MRTIVKGESSKETSVDSGVPQGTVLGPIMFLCHINYLPDRVTGCVNSSVCLSVYLPTIAYYTEQSKRKTTSHCKQTLNTLKNGQINGACDSTLRNVMSCQ